MKNIEPSLSFCITCKNRLKQIKETLPQNLLDNQFHNHLIEYRHVPDPLYNKAIPNSKEEGLLNVKTKSNWTDMNFRNYLKSKNNIRHGQIFANRDKSHIGIVEDIYTFELEDS